MKLVYFHVAVVSLFFVLNSKSLSKKYWGSGLCRPGKVEGIFPKKYTRIFLEFNIKFPLLEKLPPLWKNF